MDVDRSQQISIGWEFMIQNHKEKSKDTKKGVSYGKLFACICGKVLAVYTELDRENDFFCNRTKLLSWEGKICLKLRKTRHKGKYMFAFSRNMIK